MSLLDILYRGPLESCNYACPYCPFAKRKDGRERLRLDARALERFVDWAAARRERRLGILFTPWGEALIRRAYRDAMVRLSHMPHVEKVAAQTNLSWSTGWLDECEPTRIGFWCTFHPGETTMASFLRKCVALGARGIGHSVGVVGKREHFPAIAVLRRSLPRDTYLWVNAYRAPGSRYYTPDEIAWLESIDPLFAVNLSGVRSRGRACAAGETAIAVDGDGEARRCHFLPTRLGNIYDPGFEQALVPRACPASACRCHIGYSQMPELRYRELFGPGFLERSLPMANGAEPLFGLRTLNAR